MLTTEPSERSKTRNDGNIIPLLHRYLFWFINKKTAFENIVGKGEIAHNEWFLLFPQCFQLKQITVSKFVNTSDIISLFAVELKELKTDIIR